MNIDIIVVIIYFIGINYLGVRSSKVTSTKDYFLGGRSIHWSIACFSIVATETSTLTFISIPGLAYVKGMGFLQVALGYIAGRFLVAYVLLPGYFAGEIETVYEFLQNKFGPNSRKIISVLFHITRLLADSVRLFVTAIPLSVLTGLDYRVSVLIVGGATFIYTYYGGIRSVMFVDSVQLLLYIVSALAGIGVILHVTGISFGEILASVPGGKMEIFNFGFGEGVFSGYNIFSGIIGGAMLSFASHGTDHLMVQRLLACRDRKSARKAVIASGFMVFGQFLLFMILGLLILVLYKGRVFSRPDEIMPFFIVHDIPSGLRGLMLAGIFAAAMSSLSSSINSLAASTTLDLAGISGRKMDEKSKLRISRFISLLWTVVLMVISLFLSDTTSPLVEIGLGIASVTYGGMLGIFVLGRFMEKISDRALISGVLVSIAAVIYLGKWQGLFWPWFVPAGFIACTGTVLLIRSIFRE